jgi:hypothetical protein
MQSQHLFADVRWARPDRIGAPTTNVPSSVAPGNFLHGRRKLRNSQAFKYIAELRIVGCTLPSPANDLSRLGRFNEAASSHDSIRAPRGHSAPDRTWRQCHDDTVPEADAILKCSRLIGHSRAPRTPPLLIKGCVSNCCGEGMHKNVKIYTQHETPRNIKAV